MEVDNMKDSKKAKLWYKSKTFWVGAGILACGIVLDALGQLETGLPLTFVGLIQIVLRHMTKSPISFENVKSK